MANEKVPYYRLECFRVRCDVIWIHRWNDDRNISYFGGVTTIATHDAKQSRATFLRDLQSRDQIWTHVLLLVTATNRKNENGVLPIDPANFQPLSKDRVPAFVVRSSC